MKREELLKAYALPMVLLRNWSEIKPEGFISVDLYDSDPGIHVKPETIRSLCPKLTDMTITHRGCGSGTYSHEMSVTIDGVKFYAILHEDALTYDEFALFLAKKEKVDENSETD